MQKIFYQILQFLLLNPKASQIRGSELGDFFSSMYCIQHCFICRPLCQKKLRSNPGPLLLISFFMLKLMFLWFLNSRQLQQDDELRADVHEQPPDAALHQQGGAPCRTRHRFLLSFHNPFNIIHIIQIHRYITRQIKSYTHLEKNSLEQFLKVAGFL